jgi:site-specific recombinase XerD
MNTLRKALEEYVALRRSLGCRLRDAAPALREFVSFAEREGADYITVERAVRWAGQPRHVLPASRGRRLNWLRRFAEHRSATDPRTEVPPRRWLPSRYARRTPHLFTDKEIVALTAWAGNLRTRPGWRLRTTSTLIGLLAVTGLRIGEALSLDREDVDTAQGLLTIRHGKFGKSRLVPVHPSTSNVLCDYARRRDRIHRSPGTPAFFVSERGTRLAYTAFSAMFRRLCRAAAPRAPSHRSRPRPHDLRHRFATMTLLHAYRQRENVEARMHALSTYLGHVKVAHTYWYLSAVPELLACAVDRAKKHPGDQP